MKKLSILLMTLCLSISGLTGCGGSDTKDTSTTSESIEEDATQAEEVIEEAEEDAEEELPDGIKEYNPKIGADSSGFYFETEDIDGKSVSFSDYTNGNKLIMINMWEPWCGPCIGEMPDLEKLYQNYKSEGFLIIGVYTTPNDDKSVTEGIESTGITYPCILASENLYNYMTGYVPTTFFVDGNGNILSNEPIVGSKTYEDWENTIKEYL